MMAIFELLRMCLRSALTFKSYSPSPSPSLLVVGKKIDKHFWSPWFSISTSISGSSASLPRSNWFMQILEGNTSTRSSSGRNLFNFPLPAPLSFQIVESQSVSASSSSRLYLLCLQRIRMAADLQSTGPSCCSYCPSNRPEEGTIWQAISIHSAHKRWSAWGVFAN